MSDSSQGEGWWQASDGKWYPPQQPPAPGQQPPAPGQQPPAQEPVGYHQVEQPVQKMVIQRAPTHSLAIVSLISSLVWCCGIGSITAIVTGFMAKQKIREEPDVAAGDGLATAGIILGVLGLIPTVIVLFIWFIAALGASSDSAFGLSFLGTHLA